METDAMRDDSTNWHKQGVFHAADGREFKTGTLGAGTYLLSETGEKLTDGFHTFRPVRNFEFNGKTYILAGAGALKDILEVDADGTITNISDLMEGPDDPDNWHHKDPPGRFHEVGVRDGKFVCTLGAGEWIITPGTWEVRPLEDESWTSLSDNTRRRPSRRGSLFWLVVFLISAVAVVHLFSH